MEWRALVRSLLLSLEGRHRRANRPLCSAVGVWVGEPAVVDVVVGIVAVAVVVHSLAAVEADVGDETVVGLSAGDDAGLTSVEVMLVVVPVAVEHACPWTDRS